MVNPHPAPRTVNSSPRRRIALVVTWGTMAVVVLNYLAILPGGLHSW